MIVCATYKVTRPDMKNLAATLIYSLLVIGLVWSCWSAYAAAVGYSKAAEELMNRQMALEVMKRKGKEWVEKFSFKQYQPYSRDIEELRVIESRMEEEKRAAAISTGSFVVVVALLLLQGWFSLQHQELMLGALLFGALCSLSVGLFAPLMTIVTFKDVQFIGRVILQFESKSVIGTVETLFSSGNILVALPLILFSIVLPVAKTLFLGVFLLRPTHWLGNKLLHWIKAIGKWSMADVLVVAVILVFLSFDEGKLTDAEIHTGFYFFLFYVLLSMGTSLFFRVESTTISSPARAACAL